MACWGTAVSVETKQQHCGFLNGECYVGSYCTFGEEEEREKPGYLFVQRRRVTRPIPIGQRSRVGL